MEEKPVLFEEANSQVEAMNGFIGGGDGGFSKNTIDKSNDTLTFSLVNPTTSKLSVNLMGMDSGITSPVVNPAPSVPAFLGPIPGIAPFVGEYSLCTVNNTLYISNLGSDNVVVFDLNLPGSIITTIALPLGFGPTFSCYCPVNNQIYVGSANFPQVIRIDCATNTIIGAPIVTTSSFDPAANGFIYNSVKNSIYAIATGANIVIEVSCYTNLQVASIIGVATMAYTTFNPLLNRIYIANVTTNNLDIFDCATNLFLPSVVLPLLQPIGIVYCSFNNSVYVSEQGGAQNIVQVNCSTLAVGVPIPTGVNVPRGLAYNPINNLIYIGGSVTSNYSILNVASNTIGAPIAIANNPTSLIYDQNNNTVWFVDFASTISNIAPTVSPSVVVTLQGGVTPAEIFNDLQGKPLFFSGLKMILSDLNQLFNNMTVQYTSITGKVESSQLQPTNNVSPSNRNSNIVDITDFEFAADTNSQVSFDMEPLSTMTIAFSLRRQVSNVSFDSPNNNSVEKRENVRISGNPILDILLVQEEEEYQRKKYK